MYDISNLIDFRICIELRTKKKKKKIVFNYSIYVLTILDGLKWIVLSLLCESCCINLLNKCSVFKLLTHILEYTMLTYVLEHLACQEKILT